MSSISDNPYWTRALYGNTHQEDALRYLLHNKFHLTNDNEDLYTLLYTFEKKHPKIIKIIKKSWNDKIVHKCHSSCEPNCKSKGCTDTKDLDLTSLAFIFRNIKSILPSNVQSKLPSDDMFKDYLPHIEKACVVRNKLMHHPNKTMKQAEFDKIWDNIESNLMGMKYQKLLSFHNLKTCSLDVLQFNEKIDSILEEQKKIRAEFEDNNNSKGMKKS
jgi:hypothetical protein